jgi:hypothetical protein
MARQRPYCLGNPIDVDVTDNSDEIGRSRASDIELDSKT